MEPESYEIRELKAAAFETLMFFPGCGREAWLTVLLREYTEEVCAALGSDSQEVVDELNQWWEHMTYCDEITGICRKYHQWAQVFRDQKAVDFYRTLVAEAVKEKEKHEHR